MSGKTKTYKESSEKALYVIDLFMDSIADINDETSDIRTRRLQLIFMIVRKAITNDMIDELFQKCGDFMEENQ